VADVRFAGRGIARRHLSRMVVTALRA
jgi:hypothetical protein